MSKTRWLIVSYKIFLCPISKHCDCKLKKKVEKQTKERFLYITVFEMDTERIKWWLRVYYIESVCARACVMWESEKVRVCMCSAYQYLTQYVIFLLLWNQSHSNPIFIPPFRKVDFWRVEKTDDSSTYGRTWKKS